MRSIKHSIDARISPIYLRVANVVDSKIRVWYHENKLREVEETTFPLCIFGNSDIRDHIYVKRITYDTHR